MPADIDPDADPNAPARCPRRLFRSPSGPRCLALVLVRDATEHEQWHDALDAALTAPVDVSSSLEVQPWPARGEALEPDAQPSSPYAPDVR
jgi:hypothetical protein